MYSEDDIPPTSIGYALSMAKSGKSIVGGGTSIYKDIAYLTPSCPKYLSSDAMFSSHYLMSYYDVSQTASTVVLMELTDARETSVVSSSTVQSEVYDLATLNTENGLFVMINQDRDETKDTATVVAGSL